MRVDIPTMAGGELGEDLLSRSDTAKYRTALRRARNVYIAPAGGVYNRPGMLFAGEVHDSDRLTRAVPFQFSISQGYALELGHNTLRVVSNGGYVLRKELTVTGITNGLNAQVQIDGPHGYEIGWDVVFENIEGMTEINGMQGRVLTKDDTSFTVNIDSTAFGVFVGSGGGIPGDVGGAGGTGGDPPPPAPGDPPEPPPPFVDQEPYPIVFDFGNIQLNPY